MLRGTSAMNCCAGFFMGIVSPIRRTCSSHLSATSPSNAPLVPVLPLNWYKRAGHSRDMVGRLSHLNPCIIHPSPFHPVLSLSDCKHDAYRPSRIVQCTMELTTRDRSSLGSKRLKVLSESADYLDEPKEALMKGFWGPPSWPERPYVLSCHCCTSRQREQRRSQLRIERSLRWNAEAF